MGKGDALFLSAVAWGMATPEVGRDLSKGFVVNRWRGAGTSGANFRCVRQSCLA
jgi:hypothetical protein